MIIIKKEENKIQIYYKYRQKSAHLDKNNNNNNNITKSFNLKLII